MQNYIPHVYACRTGINSSTKTFHLFVIVPIAKSKFISPLTRPNEDIIDGFSMDSEDKGIGIHLQMGRRTAVFGDKLMTGNQTYWASYFSFEYTDGNHPTDSADYVFTLNMHKDRDGKPDKTLKVFYGDVEEVDEATFQELKDGEIALDCPYVYLDQTIIDATPTILMPEIQKIKVAGVTMESGGSGGSIVALKPASIATAASRQIILVDGSTITTFDENNGNPFFEIGPEVKQEGVPQYKNRPRPRRKMDIRAKKP